MRSGPCASSKSRAIFRAVGRFAAATESSRSRISASAPDSRPFASLRSLSAGTNSIDRVSHLDRLRLHQRGAAADRDHLAALVEPDMLEFDDPRIRARLAL